MAASWLWWDSRVFLVTARSGFLPVSIFAPPYSAQVWGPIFPGNLKKALTQKFVSCSDKVRGVGVVPSHGCVHRVLVLLLGLQWQERAGPSPSLPPDWWSRTSPARTRTPKMSELLAEWESYEDIKTPSPPPLPPPAAPVLSTLFLPGSPRPGDAKPSSHENPQATGQQGGFNGQTGRLPYLEVLQVNAIVLEEFVGVASRDSVFGKVAAAVALELELDADDDGHLPAGSAAATSIQPTKHGISRQPPLGNFKCRESSGLT